MRSAKLQDMVGGWFIGGFAPTALNTMSCEVAIKRYAAGATEDLHFHKIATEVTAVVEGRLEMAGGQWGPGDVIVMEPGEATAFLAITYVVTVVVKVPGELDDKYLGSGLQARWAALAGSLEPDRESDAGSVARDVDDA